MKIYIKTYGCTLNKADSQIMKNQLIKNGYLFVDDEQDSDLIILNTCGVKETTENKILYRIASLEKNLKKFVATGCLVANTKKIRNLTIMPVVWPSAIDKINDAVNCAILGIPDKEFKTEWKKNTMSILNAGIITYIPISEGCTSACRYCFSKIARPRLKSYDPRWIIEHVRTAIEKGSKEIEITSMDTGAYGLDIGTNLINLLNAILNLNGDFKLRIGMINPQHAKSMLNELVKLYKHPKMFKFIHIPVQTGSEKVCSEMNRPHTVKDFVEIVKRFREQIPDITVSTDIIVAYPTETDNDFKQTVQLMQTIKPDVVNISKYSSRPGTYASKLKQPKTQTKKRRSELLTKVVKKIEEENNRRYLGRIMNTIIFSKQNYKGKSQYVGRTENYKQVIIEINEEMEDNKGKYKNKIKPGSHVKVKIYKTTPTSLFGKIVGQSFQHN